MNLNKSDKAVDLRKLQLSQLKEFLGRQDKILNNRKFINSLPDKGERIKVFHQKITEEIKKRNTVDEAVDLLAKMTMDSLPNEMEWSGKEAVNKKPPRDCDDDSDDETNPLKLVATHSGTIKSYERKEEPPEATCISRKDIEDVKSFERGVTYAQKLCKKYDRRSVTERFKPNQPKHNEMAKTAYKSSSEYVQKAMGKSWEVTAATPPVPVHGSTEMLTLEDSLALQKEQAQRLKNIQLEEAMRRLKEMGGMTLDHSLPVSNLMQYRNPRDPTRLFEGSPIQDDHEEEEEEASGGAVFYNIIDDIPEKS